MGRTPSPPRTVALAFLCAVVCSTAGCGASVCKDTWLGPGRAEQFAVGFAIGAATSTIAGHLDVPTASSAALGFGAAAAVGAVKETVDLNGAEACWSWKSFAWELLGGAVGTTFGTAASHSR